MRIAIDVDDVACNFLAQCLSIMNKRHRTDYTVSQFNEFNIYNCISKKDADILANIFNEQEVWDNMLPPTDAQATIKKMVSAGNDVFFVSACHPSTHEWKTNWLERVYPFVPVKNHIYTEHSFRLDPRETILVGVCGRCAGGEEETEDGADHAEGRHHCL